MAQNAPVLLVTGAAHSQAATDLLTTNVNTVICDKFCDNSICFYGIPTDCIIMFVVLIE